MKRLNGIMVLFCAAVLAGCTDITVSEEAVQQVVGKSETAVETTKDTDMQSDVSDNEENNSAFNVEMETTAEETITDTQAAEPDVNDYVKVRDYIPDIVVDLKYATEDNFTGQVIYDFTEAYLRYGTVLKLMNVQEQLKEQGYGLKIWDAYRPFYAQERLWEAYPNPVYVADPAKGKRGHNLGNTVDITLVYPDGTQVPMPTEFDDFSTRADRDYSEIEPELAANALLLQETMYANGFTGYQGEWWDFTDIDSYTEMDDFIPQE